MQDYRVAGWPGADRLHEPHRGSLAAVLQQCVQTWSAEGAAATDSGHTLLAAQVLRELYRCAFQRGSSIPLPDLINSLLAVQCPQPGSPKV